MDAPVAKPPKRVTRGHRRHIRLPQEATVGLLESSGSGLAAGRAELDNLEERMERFGASHTSAAGVTATSIRSDDDRDTSNLRAWCTREEESAEGAVRDCAELVGAVLSEEFSVELFRDWSQAAERDEAMAQVYAAWDRTLVPARIVHEQLRRYGALTAADKTDLLLDEARDEQNEAGEAAADEEMRKAIAAAAAGGPGPGAPPPGAPEPDEPEPDEPPAPKPPRKKPAPRPAA
jgi:hypothetical protein